MPKKEYYGSAQFQPIAQQRTHEDKFFHQVLMQTAQFDVDIADLMREDIIGGNTATIRKMHKANDLSNFQISAVDGSKVMTGPAPTITQDWYPIIPLKDDDSGSGGYNAKPITDPKRIAVEKALGYMNMDLKEISDQVLDPGPIPAVGTPEWKKSYGSQWKDSPSLQAKYGTEAAWHADLVQGRTDQKDAISDITDVHVGLYATAGTLDDSNIIAMYFEYEKLLPQLTFRGYNDQDIKDFPPQTYIYEVTSGNTVFVSGMRGWTHIVRNGIVHNKNDAKDKRDTYKRKSNVNFYYGTDADRDDATGDPVNHVVRSDPANQARPKNATSTLIEIQVQLTRGTNPTYGEIRMWNYETSHVITNDSDSKITVIKGGLGGKTAGEGEGVDGGDSDHASTINEGDTLIGQVGNANPVNAWSIEPGADAILFSVTSDGVLSLVSPGVPGVYYVKVKIVYSLAPEDSHPNYVSVAVTVLNTDGSLPPPGTPPPDAPPTGPAHKPGDEEYNDLCVFFIGKDASKEVPFFKRERLMREMVQLGIYSVKIVKLKWYQQRWFSVAIFIIGIVFTVMTGGLGFIAVLQQMIISTAIGMVLKLVVSALAKLIDNPFLIAALLVVGGALAGYINFNNIMQSIKVAMDVTTLAIKQVATERMEELKKEAKEFATMANNLQEEMDKMMEEVGMMRVDAMDYLKQMLIVPDAEMPGHALTRSLDVGATLETHIPEMLDVEALWDSMIKQD